MKGSLIVVGFFVVGCLLGWRRWIPDFMLENDYTVYVLYLLMFQVGLSIGSDSKLKQIVKTLRPNMLIIPLGTVLGTLLAVAAISPLIGGWNIWDCMAVGSGFAYYSLSSILITELKTPSIGLRLATELGTIALISNIMREIIALLATPLLAKYFGRLAPICAGGATTADTTLPIITKYSGKEFAFVSICHGLIVDFSVPFLVSFFCSI